ncbi:MAG: hypothetical protein IPL61_03400 [Myxococcales bacterium]|nr:hypothetical protein [Myxococcales bacterium]
MSHDDEHLRAPPDGPLLRPVRWLFAPDLIAYAKKLLLHAFYGGELDPRDWMRIEDGHGHVEDASPAAGRERDLRVAEIVAPASGELWFDYLADTGDGGVAMFTTAFACGADLTVAGADPAVASEALVGRALEVATAGAPILPRGQFLFVGGDTAYHVADIDTLAARVQVPFARAARALAEVQPAHAPRRLYGLPGNHDYYAELVGFNRMFRHGVTGEHQPGPGGRPPLLAMPGYVRAQEASYLAIQLPWGWQLLGLDIDEWLDARQEWYFGSLPGAAKRIIATPSPPIVHGAVVPDAAHQDAIARLGLAPLYDGGTPTPGTCRLDLSGDTHHYARYQPASPPPRAPVAVGEGERTPASAGPVSYAGVVAGGGGAFHHPSFQPLGSIPARALYPRAAVSRRAISRRLLEPWSIFDGGLAWIMPLVLTLTGAIGATRSAGTRWLGDHLLAWFGIDHERPLGGAPAPMALGRPTELAPSLAFLGFGVLAVVLAYLALRIHGVTFTASQRRAPAGLAARLSPRARRYLATVVAATAMLLPFASPWFIEAPLADDLWFNAWWVLVGVMTLASGVTIGAVGGRLLPGRGRVGMIALGLAHGLAHVITPFVIARVALTAWWIVPAMVLAMAAPLALGRALLDRGTRWWVLLALWLGPWLAALALAVVGSDGVAVAPGGVGAWLVVLGVTAVVAIAIGCAHMGWYLAVAAALGAHGNEVGGAARIDDYRQFIRFRVTPERLTAFVIAIDRPSADPAAIKPYVVDVFEIAPEPTDGPP